MTVAELIALLQTLPSDARVVVDADEFGQDSPLFVGEVWAVEALEASNWFGKFLCDEDKDVLRERVLISPDFPQNPEPKRVVTISSRYTYVPLALEEELSKWERASDEDLGLYLAVAKDGTPQATLEGEVSG